jgi:hypothetical protein
VGGSRLLQDVESSSGGSRLLSGDLDSSLGRQEEGSSVPTVIVSGLGSSLGRQKEGSSVPTVSGTVLLHVIERS